MEISSRIGTIQPLRAQGRLALVIVALLCATAAACPNCKDALAGDPNAQGLARGLYYSIIFMISMPFFIFGSLSAYFYYLVRRAEAEKLRSHDAPVDVSEAVSPTTV